MAIEQARATQRHQIDFFRFARLEAHGSPGRDIEAHAIGQRAIEEQRPIDLEEMEMAADLDRPIAGMAHEQTRRGASHIRLDITSGFV
jgi:hypothetical protein